MKHKIYEVSITFRGISKKIEKLKPTSKIKIKMFCPTCEIGFERYAEILFNTGNFECQTCTLKTKLTKTLEVGTKNNRLTVLCAGEKSGRSLCLCDCGNVKEIDNFSFKSGKTKSCGCLKKETMQKVQRMQNHKKENHPNWKGGISEENNLLRTSKEYKEWRKDVFIRDNYTCKKCNKVGGTLNAHHVQEFSNHKDLIFNVNNGVTFCEKCHRKFHKKYGKKNLSLSLVLDFC